MRHSENPKPVGRRLLGACAGLLVLPCLAAAPKSPPKPAPPAPEDLTVKVTPYTVRCRLPQAGPCVIRKPVDSGYRVLTTGVELDDRGDQWIADFAKAKDTNGRTAVLRVLGRNGDLHEITVMFGEVAAPKGNGQPK